MSEKCRNRRYVEAARVECDGLDREGLIRMIAALSRRLDSANGCAERWRAAYHRAAAPGGAPNTSA